MLLFIVISSGQFRRSTKLLLLVLLVEERGALAHLVEHAFQVLVPVDDLHHSAAALP